MVSYGNYNLNKKRKGKKIVVAIICVIAILLAVLFYIGITIGNNNDEMNKFSTAVEENTELKLKINELNDQISKMQTEINNLHAELDSRPTPEPSPYEAQNIIAPTATPSTVSPRTGVR